MSIIKRGAVTQQTLDRYRGHDFKWGESDCLHMARFHLVKAGYKGLPKFPRYSSANTAARRLKELGHDSVESLLSAYMTEIPPAAMLVGDLATVDGDNALSAVILNAGGKYVGWPAERPDCCVVDVMPSRAWRVEFK